MKKILKLALMGAIAFTGMLGFTACSSSDDVAEETNPNYNPETREVTTQFVFNVSTSNTPTSRMVSADAQAGGQFRGIENATLMAYKQGTDGRHLWDMATPDKLFDLSTILAASEITTAESRRVIELSLPLNTNTLLFYGKAIKDNGFHARQGNIDFHPGTDDGGPYFKLKSRITNAGKLNDAEAMLSEILSRIAQTGLHQETFGSKRNLQYAFWWPKKEKASEAERAQIWPTDGSTPTLAAGATKAIDGSGTNTLYCGSIDWSDYGAKYKENLATPGTHDLKPLEEVLGEAYYEFTHIRTGEVRAGSGLSIERTIGDLWQVVDKVRPYSATNIVGATATSVEEYIAQLMAERIDVRLANYFKAATGTTASEFQSVSQIRTNMDTYIFAEAGKTASTYPNVAEGELKSFPTTVGIDLPLGAAQLTFNEGTRTFSYVNKNATDSDITLGVNGGSGTDINRIMFPAELCYFGNSPIRTSADTKLKENYPATVDEWSTNSKWSGFDGGSKVFSTTRAVAMTNPVNYGTALLETTVKYGAGSLEDNNSNIHSGETNKTITPTAGLFTLKGVLVGGQNNEMGWNYIRKYEDNTTAGHTGDFNFVIYDNYIGAGGAGIGIPASGTSDANYTVVFDNYTTETSQNDVFVCLELENKGADFYGEKNLIRSGATFYLVGKLELPTSGSVKWPAELATTASNDVYHALPPYDTDDGTTLETERIFIQDYMTKATFTIGEYSLQHAFVTVPDLRATQISLGLSVDLSWNTGLVFNDVLLGGGAITPAP